MISKLGMIVSGVFKKKKSEIVIDLGLMISVTIVHMVLIALNSTLFVTQ
jgi:hypothetical protein